MKSISSGCPVCRNPSVSRFFKAGSNKLAAIIWPEITKESLEAKKHDQCQSFTHFWNYLYDWEDVPYGNKQIKYLIKV
tara:strand:- start:670 stop:903 length:234 start_codon:yes stop_codon:yes gene_type:complete